VSVQARYDAARTTLETSHDARAIASARAEVAAAEHEDLAPTRRTVAVPPLPSSWARMHVPSRRDRALGARLARIGSTFGGTSAFWVHDLTTGRTAGWNAERPVPAASTVKLSAFAAALRSNRRDLRYDVAQIAGWSSNLAANRIADVLGYARLDAALVALGMTHSTYPGPYRIGTAVRTPYPRVTTARDLGRALFRLQRDAVRGGGYLGRARARDALGLLRHSLPYGGNAGLVAPWLRGLPIAQKNGWTSQTRITAAIVYRRAGPTIVVVALARADLPVGEALEVGRRVLAAARLDR
jgi:hypothetical protein